MSISMGDDRPVSSRAAVLVPRCHAHEGASRNEGGRPEESSLFAGTGEAPLPPRSRILAAPPMDATVPARNRPILPILEETWATESPTGMAAPKGAGA